MKVTIAGAGISGSYLGRLLNEEPVLFDDNPEPGCRCAWGTPYSYVKSMLKDVGIDLDNFLLCRVEGGFVNKVFIPLRNFVVIDKPKLIEELRVGLKIVARRFNITENEESLIVNATGIPTGKAVFRLESLQEKGEIAGAREKTVYGYINPKYAGYSWLFPLDEEGGLYHHGAACLRAQPRKLMGGLLSYYGLERASVTCGCGGPLFLADPQTVDLVKENAVAIGGAAGCIHPITGEGILPAMETSRLLADVINERIPLGNYASSVRKFLEKYDAPYRGLYRTLVSPFWGWVTGIQNMHKFMESFEPVHGSGTTLRLLWRLIAMSSLGLRSPGLE